MEHVHCDIWCSLDTDSGNWIDGVVANQRELRACTHTHPLVRYIATRASNILTYPSDLPTQIACLKFIQQLHADLDACRQQCRDKRVDCERRSRQAVGRSQNPVIYSIGNKRKHIQLLLVPISDARRRDSITPANVILSIFPDRVSYSRFRRNRRDAMMSARTIYIVNHHVVPCASIWIKHHNKE